MDPDEEFDYTSQWEEVEIKGDGNKKNIASKGGKATHKKKQTDKGEDKKEAEKEDEDIDE